MQDKLYLSISISGHERCVYTNRRKSASTYPKKRLDLNA